MLSDALALGVRVYLAPGPTDMRKSIDSLAAIVTYSMELNPLDPGIFVFCSRGRDRIKVLYWENNGFWLLYRRLDKGRFQWPARLVNGPNRVAVEPRQLQWLMHGLAIEQERAHRKVNRKYAA